MDVVLEKSFRENINTVDIRKQCSIFRSLFCNFNFRSFYFQGSNSEQKGIVGVELKSKILLLIQNNRTDETQAAF